MIRAFVADVFSDGNLFEDNRGDVDNIEELFGNVSLGDVLMAVIDQNFLQNADFRSETLRGVGFVDGFIIVLILVVRLEGNFSDCDIVVGCV